MSWCSLCGGRRVLSIQPLPPPSDFQPSQEPVPVVIDIPPRREIPCPDCGEHAGSDRVAVVSHHVEVRWRGRGADDPPPPDFVKSAQRNIADQAARNMLHAGYFRFEELRDANDTMIRGKIGVVAPGVVASIEKRAFEAGKKLAITAIEEAKKQINNWGSYYGHRAINKTEADHLLDHALKYALEREAPKG